MLLLNKNFSDFAPVFLSLLWSDFGEVFSSFTANFGVVCVEFLDPRLARLVRVCASVYLLRIVVLCWDRAVLWYHLRNACQQNRFIVNRLQDLFHICVPFLLLSSFMLFSLWILCFKSVEKLMRSFRCLGTVKFMSYNTISLTVQLIFYLRLQNWLCPKRRTGYAFKLSFYYSQLLIF